MGWLPSARFAIPFEARRGTRSEPVVCLCWQADALLKLRLREIRLRAERGELRSGWPDAQAVNDVLRACHEAQHKFSQAEASLRPADRKPLELDREGGF
jgi:hypothetical protein